MYEVNTHSVLVSCMTEASQYERVTEPVGGWLLLLSRLLVVFHPLALAVTASSVLGSLSARGVAVALILLLRLVVVGFGMAAGRALQHVSPGALTLAKAALLASAATDLFVYTTPFFPNNRPPGDTTYYVAASLAYHGAWLAYLARSKRVQATYGES
jgi:hypothetical protein